MAKEKPIKNKLNIFIISVVFMVGLLLTIVSTIAYSRYSSKFNSNITTDIASLICEIEVQPSEASNLIDNPYCIVNVKNYDRNNNISAVKVDYKIEIISKDENPLPELYWMDSNNQIISNDPYMNGTMGISGRETDYYKVVFINPGVQDVTRLVDFNLVAAQTV